MFNPYLKNINILAVYGFVWLLLAVIHGAVLFLVMDTTLQYAIVDSIVYNTLYAFLGLSLWFPVRYISLENYSLANLFLNHVVGGIVASALWVYSGYLVLILVFPSGEVFLDETLFWRFIIGIFIYVIIITINYTIKYYHEFREKALRESQLNALVREAQLKSLKYQINPHFIFNSLNSISALTLYDSEKARDMTIKLSGFLRNTLSKNSKQKHKLSEELENLKMYVDIEKIRFEDKFEFTETVDKVCMDVEIPNMILQPLLENAVKYGVYESIEKVFVKLTCKMGRGYMIMKVENNYDPDAVLKKGEGIGLTNIRDRLKLIYNQENLITVKKLDDYFIVNIFIPLEGGDNK